MSSHWYSQYIYTHYKPLIYVHSCEKYIVSFFLIGWQVRTFNIIFDFIKADHTIEIYYKNWISQSLLLFELFLELSIRCKGLIFLNKKIGKDHDVPLMNTWSHEPIVVYLSFSFSFFFSSKKVLNPSSMRRRAFDDQ